MEGRSAGDQHRRVADNGGRTRLDLLVWFSVHQSFSQRLRRDFRQGLRIRLPPGPDSL